MTRVQVCASSAEQTGYTSPVTLASYSYDGSVNNGRLTTMAYGNGDSVSYTYDAFDRQRRRRAKDTDWTQVLFKIFNIRTGTADILSG